MLTYQQNGLTHIHVVIFYQTGFVVCFLMFIVYSCLFDFLQLRVCDISYILAPFPAVHSTPCIILSNTNTLSYPTFAANTAYFWKTCCKFMLHILCFLCGLHVVLVQVIEANIRIKLHLINFKALISC